MLCDWQKVYVFLPWHLRRASLSLSVQSLSARCGLFEKLNRLTSCLDIEDFYPKPYEKSSRSITPITKELQLVRRKSLCQKVLPPQAYRGRNKHFGVSSGYYRCKLRHSTFRLRSSYTFSTPVTPTPLCVTDYNLLYTLSHIPT